MNILWIYGGAFMSTLEKTIDLLSTMSEQQLEIVYLYAQFLDSQKTDHRKADESVNDILSSIIGSVPDDGKSLDEYREERILEKYGIAN